MSRHREVAGQGQEAGGTVGLTAPTVLSVDFWRLSVGFTAPKFGTHGRIADGDSLQTSLEAHNRRSTACTSGEGAACKAVAVTYGLALAHDFM